MPEKELGRELTGVQKDDQVIFVESWCFLVAYILYFKGVSMFQPRIFCMQQCQVSSRRQLWFKQSYNFSWVTSFDSCECFFLIIEVDWCSHVICYDLVFGTDASGTNERLVEPVASHRVSEVLCEVSVRFQRMQRNRQPYQIKECPGH